MTIKVLEPNKNCLKEFKTPEEFNLFYSINKEDIDGKTTHLLNKMYRIEGYRITKIKNVLMLKKWENKEKNPDEGDIQHEIEDLKKEIYDLKQTINCIIQYLHSQTEGEVLPPSDT